MYHLARLELELVARSHHQKAGVSVGTVVVDVGPYSSSSNTLPVQSHRCEQVSRTSATCGQCYGAAFDIPYEALDCTKFKVAILEEYPGGNGYAIQLPGSGAYRHFLCEFGYGNQD